MKQRYNEKFLDLAFNVAKLNKPVARARCAAVLVHKNRSIVCVKPNVFKSHPFQAKYSKHEEAIFLHAETHVIMSALRSKDISIDELHDCSLYVARAAIYKDDKNRHSFYRAMAKPCEGCLRSILDYDIGAVYYTDNNNMIGQL